MWGYIDARGEWVIEPEYALWPRSFSDGLAAVALGGESSGIETAWGFIDKTGSMVIEPRFDGSIQDFAGGLAAVKVDKDNFIYSYVDKTGKLIWQDQ
jgi:hypothetical protein